MPTKTDTDWIEVIGRTLSYLCLEHAKKETPSKFDTVQKKVDFRPIPGSPKKLGGTPECLAGDAVLIAPVSGQIPCKQGILQGKRQI